MILELPDDIPAEHLERFLAEHGYRLYFGGWDGDDQMRFTAHPLPDKQTRTWVLQAALQRRGGI